MPKTAKQLQEEFDKKYITASEIVDRLNVSRIAIVTAKKRGILPTPIVLPGLKTQLWVRSAIKRNLDEWEKNLEYRRSKVAS